MSLGEVKDRLDAWTMERFNKWLTSVPQVQWKLFHTTILNYLTFFWIAGSSAFNWWAIQEMVLGGWLVFLSALNGFAYAGYKTQRTTDYGALDKQAEIERAKAGAPGTTVVTPNANVTGSPVEVKKEP